jgi:hypothetical protein
MKNKTKLTQPTRTPRRFPAATPTRPTEHPAATAPADHHHDLLVLCYYPGMPARPDAPIAA